MTTSSDYSWNPSTYAIITGALRLIGAIQTGETPPAEEYEDALASLNGLIKHFQASGIHVWSEIDAILLLQPNQTRYEIGPGSADQCFYSKDWTDDMRLPGGPPTPSPLPRPLKVPAARRYRFAPPGGTPIETPMGVLSRLDYAALPNKTNTGTPTAFFFDPQLGRAVMHIWPAPISTDDAIRFTAQRPIEDFDTQRNTADVPVEWISCLRFNLAVELALEYDVPAERFQLLTALAGQKVAACMAWDREPESVYFGLQSAPDWRN